ncbi:hypothetical protein SAMN06265222_10717 [Neorhodopirellula lusitana]|uniref:Uncharacterized protein n=1 Tax=Neorhodopirellula lusitana TaxID=445327 RepID=A0ABY1QA76_9BACT|nr:hypothetical protein [Neorhodopirellula lusitana]SMP60917.1 hypothetical protein SAMN06265222_10717 [Neorhodopirellula lusitana]
MTSESSAGMIKAGNWSAVAGLSVIHLLAFGALYLTVVQICWAAQDHYAAVGIADTTEFSRVRVVSDYLAGNTPIFVGLMILESVFVARCIRKRKPWACAYSHTVMFLIGFAMFVSFAWIIHPMTGAARGDSSAPIDGELASGTVHEVDVQSLQSLVTFQ